jgi:transposase-like protein
MAILYANKGKTQGHLREVMVEMYKEKKDSKKVSDILKISPTTILKWDKRFKETGSLENKSSAPLNPHREHEVHTLYYLHYLYQKEGLSVESVLETMNTNNIKIPRSTAYYYVKLWGLVDERKNMEKRKTSKFKEYEPGYIHVDITYGPKLNGKKQYIYVAIDRATRLMYIEVHDNKRANTAKEFLEKTVTFFPFEVTKILTDNGKEFTLKNHKGNKEYSKKGAFDLVCEAYGIDHRLTQPCTPQTNGMVERSNGTIKNNTVKIHEYASAEEMKIDIKTFLLFYILERKHSSLQKELKVKTPFQALEHWYLVKPELFKENPLEFKEKLFIMKKKL